MGKKLMISGRFKSCVFIQSPGVSIQGTTGRCGEAERLAPTTTWEGIAFPRASSPEPIQPLLMHAHLGCDPCDFWRCTSASGIMLRDRHRSLTGLPPLLQFPVGFLEASGMKSILSTGPSTRCGSGSSTSWTPTSWTPAASPSRSLTSTASTSAA